MRRGGAKGTQPSQGRQAKAQRPSSARARVSADASAAEHRRSSTGGAVGADAPPPVRSVPSYVKRAANPGRLLTRGSSIFGSTGAATGGRGSVTAASYIDEIRKQSGADSPRGSPSSLRRRAYSIAVSNAVEEHGRVRSLSDIPRGRAFSFHGFPDNKIPDAVKAVYDLRKSLGIDDCASDLKKPGVKQDGLYGSPQYKKQDNSPYSPIPDNISTMSTCTPPPSPGRMDFNFRDTPSRGGSFRLPALQEARHGTDPMPPSVQATASMISRSRSMPTNTLGPAAAGRPRGPSRDYNRENEDWQQRVDKERQYEEYLQNIDRNWYDYMVKRYVMPHSGQNRKPVLPPGPSGAALTDRGVRMREGEAARRALSLPRDRRFKNFRAEEESDDDTREPRNCTTEYEEAYVPGHARVCGCVRCRPQEYHSAGVRSADCPHIREPRTSVRSRSAHECQPRCAEREEKEFRRAMGPRTKFVDQRTGAKGDGPSAVRPAGEFDPELHERAVMARHYTVVQHHCEHGGECGGRCCEVALCMAPRRSDPPLPRYTMPKKDGTCKGSFTAESLKNAVYHNQEIFRFDPKARKDVRRRSLSRSSSIRSSSIGHGSVASEDVGFGSACDSDDDSDLASEYMERDYGYDDGRAGARTEKLGTRGTFAWQTEAPDFTRSPASSCRSTRSQRTNNSDNMSWATNHDAVDRAAQHYRSYRMQAEKPFHDLCVQGSKIHDQVTAERETVKSSHKGSAGMASVLSWG